MHKIVPSALRLMEIVIAANRGELVATGNRLGPTVCYSVL